MILFQHTPPHSTVRDHDIGLQTWSQGFLYTQQQQDRATSKKAL